MKQRLAFSIVFLFVLLLFGFSRAEACKCRSSNSPCAVYQSADAVFLATAEEITKSENSYGSKIKLKVDEAFKGISSAQETVLGAGVCDFHFTIGKKYLVYARRDKETNLLRVGLCSRTTSLENAAQDLEFVRLLVAGKSVSSIYGKVEQQTNKENPRYLPLQNIKLVMFADSLREGNKYVSPKQTERQREVFTDVNGTYRFDNLLEGMHRLKVFLPDGLTVFRDEEKINTKSPTCSEYDFNIEVDGKVSGKIVTAEGKPASQVSVHISNTEYNPYLYLNPARTDINGNYEIEGVPPGKYKIFVSPYFIPVTSGLPFTSYYLPGTYDQSEAKIFTLGYAEKLQNVNLQLPPSPITKQIRIELMWEDGTSVVSPLPPDIFYEVSAGKVKKSPPGYVYQNKEGQRGLTIYSGFEYIFYAYGKLEDGRLYETNRVTVEAKETSNLVKLIARQKNK